MTADEAHDDIKTKQQLIEKLAELRLRIENTSRDSERYFRTLISNIPDVIWTTDEDAHTTFISDNVTKIYGYTPEEIYREGERLWLDRIHPDDIGRVREAFRVLIEKGSSFDIDYRIKRKDGCWIWLHDRALKTHNEQGKIRVDGIFSDITEKKMMQQELDSSMSINAKIVESMPSGLFIYKYEPPDRLVLFNSNNAANIQTGFHVNEWFGKDFNEIWPEAKENGVTDSFLEVMKTNQTIQSKSTYYKDSKLEGYFNVSAFRMSKSLLGVVFENVTEQKESEQRIRENEKTLRALLNAPTESAILVDTNGTILATNEIAAQRLGKSVEELVGLNIWEDLPPDLVVARKDKGDEVLKTGKPVRFIDERAGKTYDNNIYPVLDDEGSIKSYAVYARDISNIIDAEQALRNSEEMFRQHAENTDAAIWSFNLEKKKALYINQAWEHITGISIEEWLENPAVWQEIIYPEDTKLFNEVHDRAKAEGYKKPFEMVYRMSLRDGRIIWVKDLTFPVYDNSGKVYRLSGRLEDITERKLAEELLQDSENKLSLIVDHSGIGIAVLQDNQRVFFNTHMHEMLGYTEAEFKLVSFLSFFHPDYQSVAKNYLQQQMLGIKTSPDSIQLLVLTKSGESRWIETGSFVTQWNGKPALQVFAFDITERKLTEENLQKSWEFNEILLNSSPNIIYIYDIIDKRNVYSSEGINKVLGYSIIEIQDMGEKLLSNLMHPDDFVIYHNEIIPRYNQAKDDEWIEFEYRMRHKDGTWLWLRSKESIFKRQSDARPKQIFGVVSDITERKQTEKELQDRLEFEILLGELSSTFVYLSHNEVDRECERWLQQIAEFVESDMAEIWLLDIGGDDFSLSVRWLNPEIETTLFDSSDSWPWIEEQILKGEEVIINSIDKFPSEALKDRESFMQQGFASAVAVPVRLVGKIVGVFTIDSLAPKMWTLNDSKRLRLFAEVIANALFRKKSEEELHNAYSEIIRLKDQLEAENIYLREEILSTQLHGNMIGKSKVMKSLMTQANQVAETDSTVLILGETGTGKELLSRAIHDMSGRSSQSLITVNCAAMPSTLVEGELFGREKGAYTGALTKQIGRFEAADGGSIFLDEIGELPMDTQAKLLRVLESGQFERLGSNDTVTVDVRVIAATNRDLDKEVLESKFREDLFYRLNVFPIEIPPLRNRSEDIEELVWTFVEELGSKMGKRIESISKESMELLTNYAWPGNVRELKNLIERSMILAKGKKLKISLPLDVTASQIKDQNLQDIEREHIIETLEKTGWRIRGNGGTAEILGLKPTTLESRIKKHGITRSYHTK